jgi:hypothetical protein
MSADNGVYILQTRTSGPTNDYSVEYEYRVAYAHNIDIIYGLFDDTKHRWTGDIEAMTEVFQNSPRFATPEDAWLFAAQIASKYEDLEYGVGLITDFKDFPPLKL